MELKLGRKLASNEVVHHADGNPLNNNPRKLVVLSRSQHQRLHACASRRPWTFGETVQARELLKAGMTHYEIAVVLGRAFSTVSSRLTKLTEGVTDCRSSRLKA